MNIVYGFGGVRTDGPELLLAPSIPEKWTSYTFKISYQGALLEIKVSQNDVQLRLLEGSPVTVKLYGQETTIAQEPVLRTLEGVA